MSDNQSYYYLRLKDSFFDDDAIKLLESMPDGYLYANILLKLYLKSLKFNGRLMYNERIPYNATMLATITRHNVGTVEKALEVLREMDLIEILDNGSIYMLEIQAFIGKTSTEADRKRAYRAEIENEKKQLRGQMSERLSDKKAPEIEIDIEIDIEIENKEKNIKKENDIEGEPSLPLSPSQHKSVRAKETRHKYGEYSHVLLTDTEKNRLIEDFGSDIFLAAVKKLDEYIQETGKKYKDHNLTMRRWVIDAVGGKRHNGGVKNNGCAKSDDGGFTKKALESGIGADFTGFN